MCKLVVQTMTRGPTINFGRVLNLSYYRFQSTEQPERSTARGRHTAFLSTETLETFDFTVYGNTMKIIISISVHQLLPLLVFSIENRLIYIFIENFRPLSHLV